jgi:hypothetical protein
MAERFSRIPNFKRLVLLQDEYIGILVDELSEIVEEGLAGGWVSMRGNEIAALRVKIRIAKKDLRVRTAHRKNKRDV